MSRRSARRIVMPGWWREGLARTRRLADPVDVLHPEADPEPGVDDGRVVGRDEDVVAGRAGLDPAGGGVAVQVADDLRVGGIDRVPGALDPHVRAPQRRPRRTEQVADDGAAAPGDRPGRALLGGERLDLDAGGRRVLVARVEAGLD